MLTHTFTLALAKADAWAIHDCLQAALAGFGGRHETADPWHALSLMAKLRPLLLRFEELDNTTSLSVPFSEGELKCIDLNVPRTAYAGATKLLLRVFHVLEEIAYDLPLLGEEPDSEPFKPRLEEWHNRDHPLPPIPDERG